MVVVGEGGSGLQTIQQQRKHVILVALVLSRANIAKALRHLHALTSDFNRQQSRHGSPELSLTLEVVEMAVAVNEEEGCGCFSGSKEGTK